MYGRVTWTESKCPFHSERNTTKVVFFPLADRGREKLSDFVMRPSPPKVDHPANEAKSTLQLTGLENSNVGSHRWQRILAVVCCILLGGCQAKQPGAGPSIDFTHVPPMDEGGTTKMAVIDGRAVGARPGQRIVLYARSGAWYVQPFVEEPFTTIRPDATWKNSTHLGTEYAALLVEVDYHPSSVTESLPTAGNGVVVAATVQGEAKFVAQMFLQMRWLQLAVGLAVLLTLLAAYRFHIRQLTREMNVRFEERLAERTRIAQDLHDTLLQDFLSASLQLYVAVERLPENSPERDNFEQVRQLMDRAIAKGQNTVRGLRSVTEDSLDLEQAFSRMEREFNSERRIQFCVTAVGKPRSLHPIIRDEVYRIGREALALAVSRSKMKSIELEVNYSSRRLRISICGTGESVAIVEKDGDFLMIRERAQRIGAQFKVWSRDAREIKIELSVSSGVAFLNDFSKRPFRQIAWTRRRQADAAENEKEREQ